MNIEVGVEKVDGGFAITVTQLHTQDLPVHNNAVATTARQAGLRAGELVRKLVHAEFVVVRNP